MTLWYGRQSPPAHPATHSPYPPVHGPMLANCVKEVKEQAVPPNCGLTMSKRLEPMPHSLGVNARGRRQDDVAHRQPYWTAQAKQ